MNRKFILFTILCFGLMVTSCERGKKRRAEDKALLKKIETRDSAAVEPVRNTAAQVCARKEVPVLCYHRLADDKSGVYNVKPAIFEAQMKMLADSGFHSVLPEQYYDYLVYNKSLPEKPVMITFDDSRSEHFAVAAPVMEKYGFRGAFFIMTITYNKKNYMTREQIAALAERGHTIGLHSWDHTMAIKYKDSADWQKQVIEPKEKLEKIVGRKVEYWAYPDGIFNRQSAEELGKYFKLSFILATKRDSLQPLQTVRRMIVPEWTPEGLLKAMRRTFK